jgi:hypothetical protein
MKNKVENKQNSELAVMVSYLEKPKHRGIVLFPQGILWVITSINLYLHYCFGFSLLPFVIPIHLISALLIVIATTIILITDIKRKKNN